ncbi:MAG TPA: DUF5011 domain-containing protein [Chitinophagaceae bacterium]|nr:DUF5011 domain-containing protein [Chitinophagaceae bacterium]
MKSINKLLMILAMPLLLITGCRKDTTEGVSQTVKVSYPEITLNGNALVIVATGATYTDAGAKLKDDITGAITDIQPTDNSVNTAVPGLYVVTFSASNANGFETSVSRLVAVTSVTGTINRQGTYLRTATGVNCYITKLADGVYEVKNPAGFSGSTNTIVYMVETAPNIYVCPPQPTDFGTMSVININFTATGVTWNVINPGFGTGQRVFIKQ